jgi:signal transduction histidine kinase
MMKRPQTLKSRIILFFCGFLAVELTLYSAALVGTFRISEDMTFTRQLSEISTGIVRHVETYGEIPDALPMHITAYIGMEDVPPSLQGYVKNRKPGIFEMWNEDLTAHAAVISLASSGKKLFIFYDVGSIESSEQLETIMKLFLVISGLGSLLLGWILARSLANRILTPVSELATVVRDLPLDEDGAPLRLNPAPDEVGTLVKTITHLQKRILEFTRREREFTAHASHELRTPVTVIKGAIEILKGRSDAEQTAIRRPLARIEHAVADMEPLIDTFLMLARQKQVPDSRETCDVSGIIEKVVSAHEYLLASKPVHVEVRTKDPEPLQAPDSMVTIALGNLVRNAFQYTMEGKVIVTALEDRVRIVDNGPGIDASRKGQGLGLTIVERLCERMDWELVITGAPGEGTRAELIFSHPGTSD